MVSFSTQQHTAGSCSLAHRSRPYVEAQPEILIAFDARGYAIAANRRAKECVPGLDQLPRHVSELFDIRAERLLDVRPGRDLISFRLIGSGAPLHARVRPPVIRASRSTPVLPREINTPATQPALSESETLERSRIVAAMTDAKWRPVLAAQALGISRATLYRRIAKFGIVAPHRR
jgi:sigma-54 dependent transcriptional regulator, acetoin dehydrogenase operon transcriptional activator AcoR